MTLGKKYRNLDQKELYKFHESIINAIRPLIREQNKAIIVVAPQKSTYWDSFSKHIKKGHRWLDSIAFELFDAEIDNDEQIKDLFQTQAFKDAIGLARAEVSANIESDLNKYLNKLSESSNIIYGIREIESYLLSNPSSEQLNERILMISDSFLEINKTNPKMQRIRHLAKNYGITEKIFEQDSGMATRINELGGIILIIGIK